MDIEELKKFAKNKIEADDLTKQVRQRIKETIWEKQNLREGFTETFKPLISQFEKPEDPKTKNIFTQNQEMLRNQLALTEGLRDNQLALTQGLKDNRKAITQGFSQIERLADMRELPGVEAIEDEAQAPIAKEAQAPIAKEAQAPIAKEAQAPIAKFNVEDFDRNITKELKDKLEIKGYNHNPSYYFDKDVPEIYSLIIKVNEDLENVGKDIVNTSSIVNIEGYYLAKAKSKNPQKKTIDNIKNYNALSIYLTNLNLLFMYKNKSGTGMFYFNNPQELLKRFELLNGSLVAGNNGVLPEYIQIAHRLRDLGVVTNNQLNTLLRKVGRLALKVI